MTKVIVTGASGFIGGAVLSALGNMNQFEAMALVRDKSGQSASDAGHDELRLSSSLARVDCVIHCAGRAHVMNDASHNPLAEFRKVNVDWTLAVARSAAAAGVKRFIFLSSIGVNGSATGAIAFSEQSPPAPAADYALSKLEAEQALRALQAETSMEIVIIRPPLVYAANAPGNFRRLLRLVNTRLPIPVSGVDNRRSMIALENLVDFIICCIDHLAAANELFLVADGEDLSTEQIVRHLGEGMGFSRMKLLPYSDRLVRLVARLAGKQGMYSQLYGSLKVDASKARSLLNWQPRLSAHAALQKAGLEYKQASHSR